MSTHLPGIQSFFRFLHHFVLAKLATSSIRVNAAIYVPGDVICGGGLSVALMSEQLGGRARFISRLHVATLIFIWPGRRKFLPGNETRIVKSTG